MSGYQARCRDIREGLLRYFIDCDTRPGDGGQGRPDAAMCDIPREMYQQQGQLCFVSTHDQVIISQSQLSIS